MLGLGALLASSEVLFNAVKILGAGYLFYLGARQLLKKSPMLEQGAAEGAVKVRPTPLKLYKSAFLTAVTNPKATMFFTALFPQFIDQGAALLPQFLILTGIFVALSLVSLSLYAALASRAKGVLTRPGLSRWVSRVVGTTFIGFGAAILTIRRQTA
ncbi:Homoserine/homoserine lactone efflux protein [compost metagenome]